MSILDKAVEEVAHVAYFIESKGLPSTAKSFVDDAFRFFHTLGNPSLKHRPCKFLNWSEAGYRCASFRKKYLVAYLDLSSEVIVCDFALQKLLQ